MDPKTPDAPSVLGEYPLVSSSSGFRLPPKAGLLALGSAAVIAIYTVGFVHTQPAAQRMKLIAKLTARFPSNNRAWKDGTYLGWGSCRHGDLQARVVIEDGRITDAAIAQCFTRYSQYVIADLPGEVVARQSADVDIISRATESSEAFYQAVTEALAHAKAS